jgi:hypothetical protein
MISFSFQLIRNEFQEHIPLGEAHPHWGHLRLHVGHPHLHLLLLAHQCGSLRCSLSPLGKFYTILCRAVGDVEPLNYLMILNFLDFHQNQHCFNVAFVWPHNWRCDELKNVIRLNGNWPQMSFCVLIDGFQ